MTHTPTQDAEKIFQALDAYDQVHKHTEGQSKKIGFQEIYAYANDVTFTPSDLFKTALATDFSLRRSLNHLIKKQHIAHMARCAAASSGDVLERVGDGFSLKIKYSKAHDDSVYVLVKNELSEDTPTLLYVIDDQNTHRLVLDDFMDGEIQLILSKKMDADLLKSLHNPGSEVILR